MNLLEAQQSALISVPAPELFRACQKLGFLNLIQIKPFHLNSSPSPAAKEASLTSVWNPSTFSVSQKGSEIVWVGLWMASEAFSASLRGTWSSKGCTDNFLQVLPKQQLTFVWLDLSTCWFTPVAVEMKSSWTGEINGGWCLFFGPKTVQVSY